MNKAKVKATTERWLDQIVIGMEFCPFAKQPRQNNQIEIYISDADSIEKLIMDLVEQIVYLEKASSKETETTLLVIPNLLTDFDDYLDCLYLAEEVIQEQGWEGVFQLASFHPNYQFDGTKPDDPENLTNRSPYPVFHILREESLSTAISSYGDTSEIPERNKQKLNKLTLEQRKSLF